MLVVLHDCRNIICEFSDAQTILDLPVFSENLFSRFVNSFSKLPYEQIYVVSDSCSFNSCGNKIAVVNNMNEIKARSDEPVVVFFSDFYIEVDDSFVSLVSQYVKVRAENGDLICIVLPYEKLCEVNFLNKKTVERNLRTIKDVYFDGYSKSLKNLKEYKSFLTDILSNRTTIRLPKVAEGIFTEDEIPSGNFSIVPPVYFDKNVQIESGSVIGPNTVIMKNTLVSSDTVIKNSLICERSFVSSGCFVDGAIVFDNVSVRRGSVLLNGSVLGTNSFVGEESIIENNALIKPHTRIDEFKKIFVNYKNETHQYPAGFYGYSPEKAATLGAALGIVFNAPRIAVAGDGEPHSTALKLALLGGLITTGALCYDFGNSFLSAINYFMEFCELDCGVFISGNKTGAVITVLEKDGELLSTAQYHNIKTVMTSEPIGRCNACECKNIRQIRGMTRMYLQNLIKDFYEPIDFLPIFNCSNETIKNITEIAVSKIGCASSGYEVVFNINHSGTRVTAESENIIYSHNKIIEIVKFFRKEKTKNTALFNDAVFLCFELIKVLGKEKTTLKNAMRALPLFYVAESTISYDGNLKDFFNKIGDKDLFELKNGSICYLNGESRMKIYKKDKGKLLITAKSKSLEMARELVGDLVEILS